MFPHKHRLIIAILRSLLNLRTLQALVALRNTIQTLRATKIPLLDQDALRLAVTKACRNLVVGVTVLVEGIGLALDDGLLGALDLVAEGCEGDDAVGALAFGGVGDEAGEFVDGAALGFLRFGGAGLLARGRHVGRGFEFFGDGDLAGLAGCGNGDALDEVGHGHFDVELHDVGEGVELDVAKAY